MFRIVLTHPDLAAALRGLLASPGAVARFPAASLRLGEAWEVLLGLPRVQPLASPIRDPSLLLSYSAGGTAAVPAAHLLAQAHVTRDMFAGALALSQEGSRFQVDFALAGETSPDRQFYSLRVVGPGMPILHGGMPAPPPPSNSSSQRWSRVIGALGEGAWRRLSQLAVAVVGLGRTGSLVATSLARMGVRELTLIDPDRIELHNLDAMDGVTIEALNQPKAQALAHTIHQINPALEVHAHATSISALAAFPSIRNSDLVISCVDDDGARWVAGCLGTLYLKPLIDVGTGIFMDGPRRDMGADVRLILPGDRCLLCLGGLSREEQVAAVRQSYLEEIRLRQSRDWRTERAGSLRSLNQIAAGVALRLLEDFLAGRVRRSAWTRLTFAGDGALSTETMTNAPLNHCPLCRLRGRGDAGLSHLEHLPHLRAADPAPR